MKWRESFPTQFGTNVFKGLPLDWSIITLYYQLHSSAIILGAVATTYSVIDLVLSLVSVVHFIYACVKQTECVKNANYSSWNCYNAFGYRLYNYVLPSVISVLVQSCVQYASTTRIHEQNRKENQSNITKYLQYFALGLTITINVTICVIFVPFFITNALPMLVGFCWLLAPLLGVLILVYAGFMSIAITCGASCCSDTRVRPFNEEEDGASQSQVRTGRRRCCYIFGTHCLVGLHVFGCLILSMAYNYSQYCYYGGGYLKVLGYEFQSRDTVSYFSVLGNDTTLVTHNILAFFWTVSIYNPFKCIVFFRFTCFIYPFTILSSTKEKHWCQTWRPPEFHYSYFRWGERLNTRRKLPLGTCSVNGSLNFHFQV